jgi:1-deoxy-D-xylulose 5-phosphate reductoisomerase
MPKPYPAAYRRQALALLDEGRTVRDVAASLRIAESCLHRRKRQQRVNQGLISVVSDADQDEVAAAKQRIRGLEEEVTILRKAAAAVKEVVLTCPRLVRQCLCKSGVVVVPI